MSSDRLRQSITVIAYVVTVATNAAANILPINGQTTASISDRFAVFVIPAGYVFSIWGVIYLLLGAFVVYQARPSKAADPTLRRLGWLPVVSLVLNAAWLYLFHYELFAATLVVMVALLVTLITIHRRAFVDRARLDRTATLVVRVPFSVYLGWITVATIANVAQTLSALGFDGFGIQPELIASVVLLVGLGIALRFVWEFQDVAYGLVIVWAYAGIAVKEAASDLVPFVAAGSAIAVAALVLLTIARRVGGSARPAVASGTG